MKSFIFILALVFLISICSSHVYSQINVYTDYDDDISEERIVSEFHTIHFEAPGDLYIKQGNIQSLKVTSDDDISHLLETNVTDGVLTIYFSNSFAAKDVEVYVTVKELRGVSLNGRGDNVIGTEEIVVDEVNIYNNSTGDISLDLKANQINTYMKSTGDILLVGTVLEHNIIISATGDVEAYNLISDSTNINITGTGDAQIYVKEKLQTIIYGTGNVIYKGNPQVDKQIYGTGSCIPF